MQALIKQEMAISKPKVTLQKLADRMSVASGEKVTRDDVWYMLNKSQPAPLLVQEARAALKMPLNWPGGEDNVRRSLAGTVLAPVHLAAPVAEVFGLQIARDPDNAVYVPESLARFADLAIVVQDETMLPELEPMTVALFRATNQLRRGCTFAMQAPGDDLILRSVEWHQGTWFMRPLNPKFPEEEIDAARPIGILTAWYRSVGTHETQNSDPEGLRLGA